MSRNSKPIFSIITISLNSEKTIRRTINSVVSQNFSSYEYLIVDGGSSDKTLDIAEEYKGQLKIISEPDKGISDAFNKGINYSIGHFICLLNSDDWFEEDILDKISKYISTEIDILYGNLNLWKGEKYLYSQVANHSRLRYGMTINHPSTFISRKVYKNLRYQIKYRYAMDYDLLLRAYKNNYLFRYLDFSFTNMSVEGVSNKYWYQTLKEVYKIKNNELNTHFGNFIIFIFSVTKNYLSIKLKNTGLRFLIEYYHKKISPIKKIRFNEDNV